MALDIEIATPETFDKLIAPPTRALVVVYFGGPDCPNCDVFASDLPSLLSELSPSNIKMVKVNAYEYPELARRFALFGIPGFVLFKDGQKKGMMRQYYGKEYWKAVVTEQAQE